jgi:ligand-binding sensor domain-containing protein
MKNYSQIYALFLVLVFCTSCKGQNKTEAAKENITPETKNIVTPSGPNGIVRNIIQDRKGNIWMAAFDGIYRYDARLPDGQGKSFTNITNKVSSARFFSVFEDSKGNLWFGSIGSGVYCYDGKSLRNFTTKEGLAGNDVSCIYEDKAGNICFGTGSGASRYDGKSFRNFTTNEGPPATQADSVHVSVYKHQLPAVSWMHNDVNAIIEDKTGRFWFGTRGNTFVYDGKTFTTITNKDGKPFTNVRSIIEDKKGNIWLGGYDGLWCYNGSTFTNLTRDFVGYIMEDKEGNIWTSSQRNNGLDGGFSAYDGKPILKRTWVISRYDGKSLLDKKPTVTEIMPDKGMLCGILEANDGSIWFGTSIGVFRYDGKTITSFNGKEVRK